MLFCDTQTGSVSGARPQRRSLWREGVCCGLCRAGHRLPPLGPTPCFVLIFPPSNTSPGKAFPRFFSLYLYVVFSVPSKYLDFRDWKLAVVTDCSQLFALFLVSRGKEYESALKREMGKGGKFAKNVTLLLSTPRRSSARPAVNDCSK